ncbi:MAG TPA: hypothetical protein PLW51_02110, partial [Bacillota bacterium]|nr:hypothetical protein [Bacillota bacterium]
RYILTIKQLFGRLIGRPHNCLRAITIEKMSLREELLKKRDFSLCFEYRREGPNEGKKGPD